MAASFFKDAERREEFLGTYAPFYLVLLLAVWVACLLLGWGLVFYGLRDHLHPAGLHFSDTLYYAGASLLTIGYGDITATTVVARMLSLVCGASGLAVVAVVISFLFSIFGGFQTREQFVVTIGARAGVPPSGVGFLEMHAYSGLRSDLANVFREGQSWTATVMETHLAYPTLMYFRSSHDYQSWVATLGTLLDAAALVVTTIDREDLHNKENIGQASLMFEMGRHLVSDFASYFSFMENEEDGGPGIEHSEFLQAVERLQSAGYKTRDPDRAWNEFASLRSRYGRQLNALARWLEIPPVQWVGDRSLISAPH
ncbi:MAG TPA: potassium channel family protein [Candidatus Baltobacteraceae bacterium]|nr:potassium channel family protein [Candidatus Baltobacteraceae bacterium]